MYIKLFAAHLLGLDGQVIEVEVDIANGLPHFDIVGLPGTALRESKDRVRSAIKNSGFTFPLKRITVNLAPAHIRKEGSYFDLAIALAILLADGQVIISEQQMQALQESVLIGELALDGSTRQSFGVFALVLAAQSNGFSTVYLPTVHSQEISGLEGVQAIAINDLQQLVQYISEPQKAAKTIEETPKVLKKIKAPKPQTADLFEDIIGQEHAKRALEVAACGFHHVLMIGPPGSGKTLMAKRLIHLLPALTKNEALEVTKIHSVAGLLGDQQGLEIERAFRAPHHTITTTGMLGGGSPVKPGEVSIAHLGVLFLDEFLEFKRPVIEALREPLEERQITITRSHHRYTFPANFLLVLALNPCPCGFYGYETEKHSCTCTATQIKHYQQKLSGPLFDRLDLQIEVPLLSYEELHQSPTLLNNPYTTQKMSKRIAEGLHFKHERSKHSKPNSLLTPAEIKKECLLSKEAEALLKLAFDKLGFSARGYHKILKLARTIADLSQMELINETVIAEAIHYRSLDRLK